MFTVRVGKIKMSRRQNVRGRVLQCLLVLLPVFILISFICQNNSDAFADFWPFSQSEESVSTAIKKLPSKQSASSCKMRTDCPSDHFSFFIHSGAANVVAPKICVEGNLVLGAILNNCGVGINIVILNGRTGEVTKTDHFDMYNGEVNTLIEFLKSIEKDSIVLMASYDEPATKLDKEARKLIADLGSSNIQELGFRDNWVFVGGNRATMKSTFEKHMKNDNTKNKYENWPELIDLEGCISRYQE